MICCAICTAYFRPHSRSRVICEPCADVWLPAEGETR
jgi:hypothetical protein